MNHLALILILVGIFSRLIPHMPNFTPLAAIALFSGAYLKKKEAYYIPLAIYILSDLIIGVHKISFFTWAAIILIAYIGTLLKNKRKTALNVGLFTFISALIFFVVTNFGVWVLWYPHSLLGFAECYFYALPFFKVSLAANLFYAIVLFGVYDFFLRYSKKTKPCIN